MSQHQSKTRKHKFVGCAETLESRLALNAGAPVPATPAPAASPISVATVQRIERNLERVDHALVVQSQHLKTFLIRRTARLESVIARATARAQVAVQNVNTTANMGDPPALLMSASTATNQLTQTVASFNSQIAQINSGFNQEFGTFANPIGTIGLNAGVPVTSLENNLRRVSAGISGVVNALTSRLQTQTNAAISQVSTLSNLVANANNLANNLSNLANNSSNVGTGTTSTQATGTTTTSGTGIGVVTTQNFGDQFTQAFSPLNAAINSVNAQLAATFQSAETQFANQVSSALSVFSIPPSVNFRPAVGFAFGTSTSFTNP